MSDVKSELKNKAQRLFSISTRLGLAGAAMLSVNCSRVDFAADVPSQAEFVSGSRMTINKGAAYTNDTSVSLQINALGANEMYVTNDPTCETGGAWEPYSSQRAWILGQTNSETRVFAKFQSKAGVDLPCIDASIVHDDVAPVVSIRRAPAPLSRKATESFELEGTDALSGIDFFECRIDGGTYQKCDATANLDIPGEGPKAFQVRAVDRAGNRSTVKEASWLKDTTKPVLQLIQVPQSPTAHSYATIRMEARDEAGGSGLAQIHCQWDSNPVKHGCSLTETNTSLSDGMHLFTAWATDQAGNESDHQMSMWTVNTSPSGDFEVLGVTGGTDIEVDNLLGTVATPTLHWSASSGAVKYSVSVLNSMGTTVCTAQETSATTYAFAPAACSLQDGKTYSAKVTAVNNLNVLNDAPLFAFTVDTTPPTITITGPAMSDDQKTAKFDFTIADPSGVRDATCSKTFNSSTQTANCGGLTTYSYTNLTTGDHTFSIAATDKAGNKGASAPLTWKVHLVICDPFNSIEGGCKKGLKGNLYYLTDAQLQSPFTDVQSYIDFGKKADVLIYMSQLLTPTRNFTDGFATSDQNVVTDDSGQKLVEYFALDFETVVKLGPADQPGFYQFGILSDDGTIVEIKDSPTGAYRTYINNDQEHATMLKCDRVGMNFDANTRLPMRVKYFQGPREQIALMLVWRKLDSPTASKADSACDVESASDYFGSDLTKPDFVNYEFGKMSQRGWKALVPENFVLPEEAP